MAVDIGELGLLIGGIGTPVAVAAIGARAAIANAKRSNRTEEKRLDLDEFAAFRETYVADMAGLRAELAELRLQFNAIRAILRRTREAFREYIRQVRQTWGTNAAPPPLGEHIRDLLSEDDLDGTFSTAEVRRMRDDPDLAPTAEGR